MKQKLLYLLIFFWAFTANVWSQFPDTNWIDYTIDFTQDVMNADNDGSPEKPWLLSDPGHLAFLAREVNKYADKVFRYASYKLTGNINLNTHLWTPIGGKATDDGIVSFKGVFDGDGYTVEGIQIEAEEYDMANGLFGQVWAEERTTVEIKNLTVTNGSIGGGDQTSGYYGSIAGDITTRGGTVNLTDCHNKGVKVKGSNITANNSCMTGGIVGRIYAVTTATEEGKITIKDCTNSENIQGGISNIGQMARIYTGGIAGGLECVGNHVGISASIEFVNCHNSGVINGGETTTSASYYGGLFGWSTTRGNGTISKGTLSVENCSNKGKIEGAMGTSSYTGGIAGEVGCMKLSDVYFTKVYNSGDIVGGTITDGGYNSYTGGLFGHAASTTETEIFRIQQCWNTGKITGSGGKSHTGGLMGRGAAVGKEYTVSSCFNSGDIIGGNVDDAYTGGLVGLFETADSRASGLSLTESYSTAAITAYDGSVGGLVGETGGWALVTLSNCYAAGSITGNAQYAGGIAGRMFNRNDYPVPTITGCLAVMKELNGVEVNRIAGACFNVRSTEYTQQDFPEGRLTDNYSWHPSLPAGTTEDEKGAEWETGTFQEEPFLTLLANDIWNLDEDNERMPWLNAIIEDQFSYPNPWERNTPPVEMKYYTITLTVASGIGCNYQAGQLTVAENDALYLQFQTEDPALSAADILFLVDGKETAFKDLGGNYAFTYTLNDIQSDHTVLIAQREYPVTLPETDGAVTDPAAGTHSVAYGEPFRFTLTPQDEEQDLSAISVLTNGELLYSAETRQTLSLHYTIEKVTGPVDITIEGVNPVGNLNVGDADIKITMDNGQTSFGHSQLIIDNYSGSPVEAAIYNLQGQLIATRRVTGTEYIPLPAGIYVVKAGTITAKVIAN